MDSFLACEVSLSLSDSLQRAGAIHTIPSLYERRYNINSQHVKSQSETHIFTVWILSFFLVLIHNIVKEQMFSYMYTGINLTIVSKDYIPSGEKHRKQHTAEKLFYKKGTWIQLQIDCNFFLR